MGSSGGRSTTPRETPLPAFSPRNSGDFAGRVLAETGVQGVLIGRLAVWAWISEDQHKFTKDVDLAVLPQELPLLCNWLRTHGIATRELPIGGVGVRLPSPSDPDDDASAIRVDFIDRTNPEWGDFGDLVAEAVADARERAQTVRVGHARFLVVSPTWLVVLKLLAGRGKDDDDVRDLLQAGQVDADFIRECMRRHRNLAILRSRFEEELRRSGHPAARRGYEES